MSTEVVVAKALIDVIVTAYEQGWVQRLVDMFKRTHRVLLLGATGTGKSQLLKSLTTLMPEAISYMNRTQFAELHRLRIGKTPFEFIDTPGDVLKKPERLRAIRVSMRKGLTGVINVVSYGYHEYRIGREDVMTKTGLVRQPFLARHREAELRSLEEWTPLIGPEVAGWLITVVTKADLWWNQSGKVLKHYESGDYHKALGSVRSLSTATLAYSALRKKFYGQGPVSARFDDSDRLSLRSELLSQLLSATGKMDV